MAEILDGAYAQEERPPTKKMLISKVMKVFLRERGNFLSQMADSLTSKGRGREDWLNFATEKYL